MITYARSGASLAAFKGRISWSRHVDISISWTHHADISLSWIRHVETRGTAVRHRDSRRTEARRDAVAGSKASSKASTVERNGYIHRDVCFRENSRANPSCDMDHVSAFRASKNTRLAGGRTAQSDETTEAHVQSKRECN